jgi:hypothetical protein
MIVDCQRRTRLCRKLTYEKISLDPAGVFDLGIVVKGQKVPEVPAPDCAFTKPASIKNKKPNFLIFSK